MPNCFTLTSKANPEAGPVPFAQIDDEMRTHFDEPPDDKAYLGGWYDTIGLSLAMGHSWDKMREIFSPGTCKLVDYLEERYTPDAWAEIGRR